MNNITYYISLLFYLITVSVSLLKAQEVNGEEDTYKINEIPNSKKYLLLDRNTGRISMLIHYYGNKPVKLKETGKSLDPKITINAYIERIEKKMQEIPSKNPQKYVEEGLMVESPSSSKKVGMITEIAGETPWPVIDHCYELKKDEIIGSTCFIWELENWKEISNAIEKHRKSFILFPDSSMPTMTKAGIDYGSGGVEVDYKFYQKIKGLKYMALKKRKSYPALKTTPENLVKEGKQYPLFKLDSIRRLDQGVCTYLDKNTGRLFSYFYFDGTVFQKSIDETHYGISKADYKTIDLTHKSLEPLLNIRKSIMGLVSDFKKYSINTEEDEEKFSWVQLGPDAPWSWKSIKDPIPLDRKHTLENNTYIFGSTCYIWQTDIWEELGKMLKKHKQGYVLFPTRIFDQIELSEGFFSENCIKVDAKLYNRMEKLRKKLEAEEAEK